MIGAMMAKRASRGAFDALNRHDLDAFMKAWSDDAVFEFPGHSALSGRYEGPDEIRGWFARWWTRFPTTTFTLRSVSVDHPMALTGNNTIHVEWDLDETDDDGHTYHVTGITTLHAKGGKVDHVKDYIFDQDVIQEIWGTPAEA
jgi:ketosteroid isomerase-like protein